MRKAPHNQLDDSCDQVGITNCYQHNQRKNFRRDEGTGNAIFVLRRLVERSVEKQRDVYTCFIDYSKAFDTVKHESLVELLQSLDVDKSETRLLINLYWKQTAAVRCGDDISEWLDIKQGVRQGCVVFSSLVCIVYGDDYEGTR